MLYLFIVSSHYRKTLIFGRNYYFALLVEKTKIAKYETAKYSFEFSDTIYVTYLQNLSMFVCVT